MPIDADSNEPRNLRSLSSSASLVRFCSEMSLTIPSTPVALPSSSIRVDAIETGIRVPSRRSRTDLASALASPARRSAKRCAAISRCSGAISSIAYRPISSSAE